MKKISIIFGTRPEAIKLCPLILALRNLTYFKIHVCVTGQHREMLDQILDAFEIIPDVDLGLMQPNQTPASLTSRSITALDSYINEYKPNLVLVQGDTTTVFSAALTAFYHKIQVGHVEAGLRTWNKFSPFPEEIYRVLTSRLADYHFAPTELAKENLLKEGIFSHQIFVTGNTVIDALYFILNKIKTNPPTNSSELNKLMEISSTRHMVLITGHRRENFGQGFKNICTALNKLAENFPETVFIYPVHLNPNVRKPVLEYIGKRENIYLIEPLSYMPFVALMERAYIILTDSGGIQEEAPGLGKPVLVMRDTTERPEGVEAGTVKLVGTDIQTIFNGVSTLLTDETEYQKMAKAINPYGDGKACQRIIAALSSVML